MNVKDLIEQLQKLPPEYTVLYPGGNHKDDWQEVQSVKVATHATNISWHHTGVFLNDIDY